jgi:hypothetical protein
VFVKVGAPCARRRLVHRPGEQARVDLDDQGETRH